MEFTKKITNRGFVYYDFKDRNDKKCTIQKSSLAFENAIWLGRENERMHLTRSQVFKLIMFLLKFVISGKL